MKRMLAILISLTMLLGVSYAMGESATGGCEITLAENPTTGYTWSVAVSDETIVTVTDEDYTADANPTGAVGTGGTHSWTITGKAAGTATVTFTLGQSWEGGETADTIAYDCTVDDTLNVTAAVAQGVPEKYETGMAVVELQENPTTGYEWSLAIDPEGILTVERDAYQTDADTEGLTGAGGVHAWALKGEAAGETTLTFTYARSWEKDEKPAATVTMTYQVDDTGAITLTQTGGDYEQYAVE